MEEIYPFNLNMRFLLVNFRCYRTPVLNLFAEFFSLLFHLVIYYGPAAPECYCRCQQEALI